MAPALLRNGYIGGLWVMGLHQFLILLVTSMICLTSDPIKANEPPRDPKVDLYNSKCRSATGTYSETQECKNIFNHILGGTDRCDTAEKAYADAKSKFLNTCKLNGGSNCEDQAFKCAFCKPSKVGTMPTHCKPEVELTREDRDSAKQLSEQRLNDRKQYGIKTPAPKDTSYLFYCPPYAGKELSGVRKTVEKTNEKIEDLEKEIQDLRGKLSTDEDSVEGRISQMEVDFKDELEKAQSEYDEEKEKIETNAKEKEKDLNSQFQKNVDGIEGLKLKLKDLENQRVVALRKEGELKCLDRGQKCVDDKLAERTVLLKNNRLKSQGGLMGTLNNTGKKMIEKNCANLYNQCLKNPATTAMIEAINRQFDLQVEATHKEIQMLIQQNASVITQLKEIDPEKAKALEKMTAKFQKKTESLRASYSTKMQQLQKAKASLEAQIKTAELKLKETKGRHAVDMAYSDAAEKAYGSENEEASKNFTEYMTAFEGYLGAADDRSMLSKACPGGKSAEAKTLREKRDSWRGTSQ